MLPTGKKEEARALYQKGVPYNQIVTQLGIAKSTVSLYCRDLVVKAPKKEKPLKGKIGRPRNEVAPKPLKERKSVLITEPPYEGYYRWNHTPKDGIPRVHLKHPDSKQQIALSLARFNMSIHLGRILEKQERVLHIDGRSDEINNLKLTTFEEMKSEFKEASKKACSNCTEDFYPKKATQFLCSQACRAEQNGKIRRTASYKKPNPNPKPRAKLPPKPKKVRILFTHECVICEEEFKSFKEDSDVCVKPSCKRTLAKFLKAEVIREQLQEQAI